MVLARLGARLEMQGGVGWCDCARTGAMVQGQGLVKMGKARSLDLDRLCMWRFRRNHRMSWVGRDLEYPLISSPAGLPPTRADFSGPHPTWP